MLIFSFAKVVFWAQLGKFIYNMGSIGELNLQMQSNSNLVIETMNTSPKKIIRECFHCCKIEF